MNHHKVAGSDFRLLRGGGTQEIPKDTPGVPARYPIAFGEGEWYGSE